MSNRVATTTKAAGLAAILAFTIGPAGAQASLSGAKAAKLQGQVEHVLGHAKTGARQIAPNRVSWPRDGVTLTIPVPGTASTSGLSECKRGYACLWMHSGYRGWIARFYHYGTYRLSDYGLGRFDSRGASSYYNHQTGGARATLHATYDVNLWGHADLAGALNDRGKSITLAP
jgi:hypothetical protein